MSTADGRARRLDVFAQQDSDFTLIYGPGTDLSDYTLQVWVQTQTAAELEQLSIDDAAITAEMNHDGADTTGIVAAFAQADVQSLGAGKHWLVTQDTISGQIWTVGRFRATRTGGRGVAALEVPTVVGGVSVALDLVVVSGSGSAGGGSLPAGTAGQMFRIGSDGETVEVVTPNTAGGPIRANENGHVPDVNLSTDIVRESELSSAVNAAVTSLIDGAPATLDTFAELAAALGDDEEFASSVMAAIAAGSRVWLVGTVLVGSVTVEDMVGLAGWAAVQTGVAADPDGIKAVVSNGVDDGTITPMVPDAEAGDVAIATTAVFDTGTFAGLTDKVAVYSGTAWSPLDIGIDAKIAAADLATAGELAAAVDALEVDIAAADTALAQRAAVEAVARDWDASTDARLRCFPTATSMTDVDAYAGTWEITNAGTGTGTLPPTPAGLDVRALLLFHAPYRDDELNEFKVWPFQQFREWISLTRAAATGGDTWEFALLHPWAPDWATLDAGVPVHFGESTVIGAAGEGPGLYVPDPFGPLIGVPVYLRGSIDCANETMTLWRGLPYDIGHPDGEVADGIYWVPVGSRTDPQYASMRDDGGASETVKLGIQNRCDYAWIKAYEFGDPTPILDIGPDQLNAAVGDTSFVCGAGNTVSSPGGTIEAPASASASPSPSAQFWTAGSFYNAPNIVSGGTRAISSGNAIATPFLVEKDDTIDGLQVDLSTASAGSLTFDLHLMEIDPTTGYPTDSVFTVAVTTTGTGTQVLSATATAVDVPAGLYWTVVHNRSAGTITTRSVAVSQSLSPVPAATSTSANQLSCYSAAAGTSATPITSYPAGGTALNQGSIVSVRAA